MNTGPVINLNDISSLYDNSKSWPEVKSICGTKAVNLMIAIKSSKDFTTPNGFLITKNGFDTISNPISAIKSNNNGTSINSKNALNKKKIRWRKSSIFSFKQCLTFTRFNIYWNE